MIANLANTLIGIWLVYVAILDPQRLASGRWSMPLAAVIIVALAIWARRSDALSWHSDTNVTLGIILLASVSIRPIVSPEAMAFWLVFWIGIGVAVISLWAALYRPEGASAAKPEGSAR